ncbi:glycosyltransferase family 2 protein [Flavobacterium sp. ANB]|uniref:glycosyltransferase family 2 protein n=1 Tax=unclassified Flavobacterium TaxID=196869 RepID=UPI0012B84B2C|nr:MULTISPECIES: glycosyltransferase family 2 protein [unclassified Flavobacterium]MBF4518057.1 glycosyltransferase family 2 protein [Flavobacterium sp. ANB]MTD71199.1 glycosyltransferase [Flavobacterium sp. LC2016-13]
MKRIAVLLTCFNRKEKTIKCLNQLFKLKNDLDIYLVDDGSTDGTSEAILKEFRQVNLIEGSGNLFWNKGMNLAWEHAAKNDYDYYLWLNDDVVIYENCFEELFYCATLTENKAIISGIIESSDKKDTLYGGYDFNKKLIKPNGKLNAIKNLNGNVVLVPKKVYAVLGNLDNHYHHDLGDVDYGLRAQNNGIGVYTTRIGIASGEKNDICRVRQNNTTILKRFKRLYAPLGANPKIIFYFRNKYFGFANAFLYVLFLHFINILPDRLNILLFGNRYV